MSTAAIDWLLHELRGGAKDRRELLVRADELGFTLKQLRNARQRLGLVVSRHGNRRGMRSVWALPTGDAIASVEVQPSRAALVRSEVRKETPPCSHAINFGTAGLTEHEATRAERRVVFFVDRRGIALDVARSLALKLVARDRAVPPSQEGACPECQQFSGPFTQNCPTPERRSETEVWICWFRRADAP